MKMKKITALAALLMIGSVSFAQLKVDQFGRVGMGTNYPNSGYRCHVQGNLLLTNYPATPLYELMMKVGNGYPGTEIGSSVDMLAIWSANGGYNKVYAEEYYKASDSTLKSNIVPVRNGLEKVMQLKAYSYDLADNNVGTDGKVTPGVRREYGFLSQEVEKALPEVRITQDMKEVKLMDYDQVIPLLVASTKEQQAMIETLKKEVELLKGGEVGSGLGFTNEKKTVLYQNQPNPFKEKTLIGYEIAKDNFRKASILIFDMNGTLLKSYPIGQAGKGELSVNGNELKAGMYIYSLIVNDKEMDSKKMILLN